MLLQNLFAYFYTSGIINMLLYIYHQQWDTSPTVLIFRDAHIA